MSRRRQSKSNAKIFMIIILIFVFGLATIFSLPKLIELVSGPPDFDGPGQNQVKIEILAGDSIAKIGNTLKTAGVVKSVDAFTAAAAKNPNSQSISPGFYHLFLGMRASDAIESLLNPEAKIVNRVVIPEGKRASDVYSLLNEATGIPVAEFEKVAANSAELPLPQFANGNVEGFLFPATYEFRPDASAKSVLVEMINKFNSVAKEINLEEYSQTFGLSPYEIITIASLLEVEGHPRDFDKVARVVYNRLAKPMRLEFDSTVNYGLGQTDVIITSDLLAKETPYNTYLNDGLVPTPIGNPGKAAIEAALNPAQGDWLYFITTNLETQETKFTSSYKEFLIFKDEFLAYCDTNPEICFK